MPKLSASAPLIHDGAKIVNSTFGAWCEVGAGAVIVKLALLNGQARAYERGFDLAAGARLWRVLSEGEEAAVDAEGKEGDQGAEEAIVRRRAVHQALTRATRAARPCAGTPPPASWYSRA